MRQEGAGGEGDLPPPVLINSERFSMQTSSKVVEETSLLKNSLGARVQPTLGTKYAGFEAFGARY
jgi:hypothetical protein